MTLRDDQQSALWDEVIDDEELEELIEMHQRAKEPAANYRRLHKALKEQVADLEVGRRYRIGRFLLIPKRIDGGGFEVPEWRSKTADIAAID